MQHPFAKPAINTLPDHQTDIVIGGQQDDALTSADPNTATVTKPIDRIVGPPKFYTQALGEDGGFVPPGNL